MPVQFDAEQMVTLLSEMIATQKAGGVNPTGRGIPYGYGAEMTWTQWKQARDNGMFENVRIKESSLTPFSNTLYGCTGLFGICGPDEIIGLTMVDDPLVDWLGFFPDTICEKFIKGWTYTDVQGTAAGSPIGTVYGEQCDDPPIAEKGVCEFFIGDFGTLRACGETVKVGDIGLRKCDKQPTYTIPIEGVGPVRIDNDLDLETITGMQVIKHELSRLLITGDKTVAGQFDGLTNLVRTGYMSINQERCTAMDSVVVDWANDDMTGAVNGHGSIITKVRDVWRRIRQRISFAKMGMPAEGDVVLVMPSAWAWELMDEWAFWSFRETNSLNNQVVYRDAYELRDIREKYANGLYGAGYITVDGFNIHIIAHDWMPFDQAAPNFISDIYLLVRRIGGKRVLQGQYIPLDMGADAVAKFAGYNYFSTDTLQGGRVLRWMKYQNSCVSPCALLRPRCYLETPWAQGVIQNVGVDPQFAPMSLDPASNYFIEQNKVAAVRHTQYWYNDRDGSWFS
jgi:hypothetical protein